MGKATLNKSGVKSAQTVSVKKLASEVEEPVFSSGDLGQLQEILFGQQQRSTHEQMSELQRRIDEQLSSLGNMLNSRLNQLTETVEKNQLNFDKQFNESRENDDSRFGKLNQSLNQTKAELQTEISALTKSANEDANRFEDKIIQHKSKLLGEINDIKREIQNGLSNSINDLHCTKLDKQDLARLLQDLSNKISDTTATPKM